MHLRRSLLPLSMLLLVAAGACAGAEDDAAPPAGGTPDAGTTEDAATEGGQPEAGETQDAAPDAPAEAGPDALVDGSGPMLPPVTPTGNFALWKVYLGDQGFDDVASPTAWQAFADDIDGKSSDGTSADDCTPTGPASNPAGVDGPGGIDNAFGKILVPLINGFTGVNFGDQLNSNIAAGEATLLVRTDLLTNGGAGTHPVSLYTTTKFVGMPAFDGSDVFEIDQASLSSASIDDAIEKDPSAKLTGDVLTLAPSAPVVISSSYAGVTFGFPIRKPRLTLQLDANRGRVVAGKITGVLNTDEFIAQLRLVVGAINTSYCSGFAWNGIVSQIQAAQDILDDGTNSGGTACNAISVGMGFKAVAAAYGPNPKSVPAPVDLCP
jgi:hypothetical protein